MSRYRKFTTICCAAVFALGLAACGGGDDGLNTSQEQELQEQKNASDEMVAELQEQLAALQERLGIEGNEDPGHDVAGLQAEIERLEGQIEEAEEEQMAADMKAMAATAAKLYAGIGPPMDTILDGNATTLAAEYVNDAIHVKIGANDAIPLMEDKKTMVADNHGWEGKRYADAAGGPMVEAMVYSNVMAPEEGKKFSAEYDGSNFDGMMLNETGVSAVATRYIESPSFDHGAGVKPFPLPKDDPSNPTTVAIPGSLQGVAGTYSCMTGDTRVCAVRVADKGFELGTIPDANTPTFTEGVWTFKPSDPDAKVMSPPGTTYASYGWWIHKTENDKTYMASAFMDYKGAPDAISGLLALNGMATYMGGAAGKYALSSSTGGTNDAGHFTAMATLEADFTKNMISGTINNFMGADDMPRDWSVELMAAAANVGDTGAISSNKTKWTIGGTAAAASGSWTGQLYDNGKDGVPMTAVGTFHSAYGSDGMMVGAFGANVQ